MEDNKVNNEEQKNSLAPDQQAEWGDVMNLSEPSLVTEQGTEVRAATEEQVIEEEAEEVIETQAEEFEAPSPVVQAEDPGEYVPKDYSFEVTVYDEEGKNGKQVKVSTIQEWEDLLDKDSNFGTSSALLKAQRLATKMETKLENDQDDYQKKKDAFDTQNAASQAQLDSIVNIEREINYLVSSGKLPKIEDKDAEERWKEDSTAWKDKEFVKTPGVKEQVALLTYMRKESDARQKVGLSPFSSALDAFNAMQLDVREKASEDTKKKAGEARKTAGARVSGTSPAPVSNAPKGISVGRGGSLRDLDSGWGV